MAYLIQLVCRAADLPLEQGAPGDFLKAFDVDAHRGIGTQEWTSDAVEALAFSTSATALAAWRSQSRVCPLRDDGQPNRPLTAFTIEIVRRS